MDVEITFLDQGGVPIYTTTNTIPHWGTHIYVQKAMSDLPTTFVGSAIVRVKNGETGQSVAATVRAISDVWSSDGLMSYSGLSSNDDASMTHYVPLVRKGDPDTFLMIMNTDAIDTATVYVDLYPFLIVFVG